MKNSEDLKLCIICREEEKRAGSFFCEECFKKDIFIKIAYFQKSPEFKYGFNNTRNKGGRLPTLEQRERENNTQEVLERQFKPFWRRGR
jgi:hypothetical protein